MGNQNNLLTVPIHVEPETTQEQPESPKMAPKDTILERAATTDNKEAQVEQHEEDTVETQPTSSLPSAKVQEEAVDFSSPSTQNKEDAEFELEGEAEIKAGHTGTASAVKAQEQTESLKIPSLMDNIVEPADITNKKAAEVDPLLEIKPQDTTTVSPAVNTEMDGIGETQRIDTASKDLSADENVSPTLVVEKIDSNPSYGDDFGAKATIAQKDAHLLRAKDAEPDYVMVRAETSTPDLANVAAEVADSAATLDQERDPPTPPISDEEAGRIGFRRMSSTPIPEVCPISLTSFKFERQFKCPLIQPTGIEH
jgi:hypothetical protein